jgi:hypothetical protein
MTSTRILTLVIAAALSATPAVADQGRRRNDSDQGRARQSERRERAVPRSEAPERNRQEDRARQPEAGRQRQLESRQYQPQRQFERQRDASRRYDNRSGYGRPYYSGRSYGRTVVVPRIIRPSIVTVVPYRPYVYRPSLRPGVYYGADGYYPYGYTPRAYYDPIPGRLYGGLRITGAPREAQVFADGYYVGIVNDFDGIFQHLNLEAGGHRIEIEIPGYQTIAFDVMVQPGRTTTLRADY